MNKKKTCTESLAAQEGQVHKIPKYEPSEVTTLSPSHHIEGGRNADSNDNLISIASTDSGSAYNYNRNNINSSNSNQEGAINLQKLKSSSTVQSLKPFLPVEKGTCSSLARNEVEQQIAVDNSTSAEDSETSNLNNLLFTDANKASLHKHYQAGSDYLDENTGVTLSCSPFRHGVFPNFLVNLHYVNDLESALLGLPLRDKNNDLYKFSQSRDLNDSELPAISIFRSLCDDVRSFISGVTDIPLNSKVDLFCSQYKYTDVLLCHDDELEERRIAFIYYLVPGSWSSSDGGSLDLFDANENGQPKGIVNSIVPKRNSFLFFEVSAKSFHQVAEVLAEGKIRLSISGWFHGPPLTRPPPHVDILSPAEPYGSIEEETFYAWLNPLYLAPEVQTDVRKHFEEDSEIELTDFLQEDKYNELVSALEAENIDWSLLGPANKRNYYAVDRDKIPPVVSEFLRIIHSDAAFLVLSNLTGLKLHSLAPSSDDDAQEKGEHSVSGEVGNPRCRSEVRKWEHGCYTLAHDTDSDLLDFALDTMMYIGCEKEWSFDNGGYTSYIGKGEEEELLSVCPSGNCLALVYRDKDTMKFVKQLNHKVTKLKPPRFFEVNTVYYE